MSTKDLEALRRRERELAAELHRRRTMTVSERHAAALGIVADEPPVEHLNDDGKQLTASQRAAKKLGH